MFVNVFGIVEFSYKTITLIFLKYKISKSMNWFNIKNNKCLLFLFPPPKIYKESDESVSEKSPKCRVCVPVIPRVLARKILPLVNIIR